MTWQEILDYIELNIHECQREERALASDAYDDQTPRLIDEISINAFKEHCLWLGASIPDERGLLELERDEDEEGYANFLCEEGYVDLANTLRTGIDPLGNDISQERYNEIMNEAEYLWKININKPKSINLKLQIEPIK